MRNRQSRKRDTAGIPTLHELVESGAGQRGEPPNLDLFEDPPAGNPSSSREEDETRRLRRAFLEELDRRVENLVRSRVQRLADRLAEDVMSTLKRELAAVADNLDREARRDDESDRD